MDDQIKKCYGVKNFDKVKRNMVESKAEAKKRFLKKYPYAIVDKFSFEVELTDNGGIEKYTTY